MAFYTGRSGKLYLSGVLTAQPTPVESQSALKVREWSIDTSLNLLETTTLDTAVQSYTPGTVSSTGSATVMYYRTEAGDVGVQFDSLLNKVMKTTTTGVTESDRVGMVLRAGAVQSGIDVKDDIAFNAYITNASITVGTGELTTVAVQFTVDGPFIELVDA